MISALTLARQSLRSPVLKSRPEAFIEKMLGKPPHGELSHEYDMIKGRLLRRESSESPSELLSGLKARADTLDAVDRVFFIAYFSELYRDEDRKLHFTEPIQWGRLIEIAEKEAREGQRVKTYDVLASDRLNQDKGKVCPLVSPRFMMAFLFRNVYKVSVVLPEQQVFISAPADAPDLLIQKAGSLINMAADGLHALEYLCKRFIWKRDAFDTDLKNNIFRDRDPNDYWGIFQGEKGERYTVKMRRETLDIYRCSMQTAFFKGECFGGVPIYVDTGEFSIYSPAQNAFFNAYMESGEIAGACRSKTEPSKELAALSRQVMGPSG
jgi:hypothetical protein